MGYLQSVGKYEHGSVAIMRFTPQSSANFESEGYLVSGLLAN